MRGYCLLEFSSNRNCQADVFSLLLRTEFPNQWWFSSIRSNPRLTLFSSWIVLIEKMRLSDKLMSCPHIIRIFWRPVDYNEKDKVYNEQILRKKINKIKKECNLYYNSASVMITEMYDLLLLKKVLFVILKSIIYITLMTKWYDSYYKRVSFIWDIY